ncbi:adenylyl-sulfate kinase [Anaerobacillus alkalidiazotrophicus]|uniref:Adenylyl-sulfate kinase n=1 Tax=Anaerobacillus alkalidiazotrophicus TaxID=472963 RepID=A0A1S2M2B2_9BACI|nr:adenylyl-sulfate kinase [Anaerobacillus alkalidiazotrophicus]OIJ18553.1 adenylyl-sulfate kinase [Anaerobacillus alkalidiazotrophicus]
MENNQNIKWHKQSVTKLDRQKANNHKSFVIWFTGLSGSGKSTIANVLEVELFKQGVQTFCLDGDNIRHGLNENLGFTDQDRKENIRRIAEVAKLFVNAGVVVLVSVISPFSEDRNEARKLLGNDEFFEVYVKCPLEVCEKRDPKGLYKKAKAGHIKQFTGISQRYEQPTNPELTLDTSKLSVNESVTTLLSYLKKHLERN